MATEGETKFSCCSACLHDGMSTVAKHYCVECEMYFCTKCAKSHKTIPVLRKHHVNDLNSSDSTDVDDETTERGSESVHSLRCSLHKDKLIDTYCNDHDEVCCATCAVIIHRSCTTVMITIAAKDFKSSPDMIKCKESLTENVIKCKQGKKKRLDNLDCISKQKLEFIEKVDQYEEKTIAKIKELANTSRKEIRAKYKEHETAIETYIEDLDAVITTNKEYVDKIERTDDEILFVYVKSTKLIRKVGEILQTKTTLWTMRALKFYFDEKLENRVVGMKSLGQFAEEYTVKKYHAAFEKNVNPTQKKNAQELYVMDMCLMDSRELLLTDHGNKKLKRFNSDLQFNDEIPLTGPPIAVCKIDKHEVAVRIWTTKIVHIVSVGQSMQVKSSFTLAGNGYGMTYDSGTGEIFACENNRVSVYSKTGHKLRSCDRNTNGEPMFSKCRQIALSENMQDIYLTDETEGLIVLDKSGNLKIKVPLSGVGATWPLCVLPGHICLTGINTSGVIVQINEDGQQVGNLIESKDGRTYTYCVVYDRTQSKLIVGGYSGVISVYKMSAEPN